MTSSNNVPRFTIENNVLKGKVISYDDDYTSFGEFVLRTLEDNPDQVGQIDAVTDEEWTYEKMRERSVRCALWMKSQGLGPRDVIALCSENRMDYAMPCFAALYLGAIFNLWDATTNTDNFRHQMKSAKPKIAFVSEATARVVAEAAKNLDLDLKIVVFGRLPGFLEFDKIEELEQHYKANAVHLSPHMINRLVKSGAVVRHDLSSLRVVCSLGGSLPMETYTELKNLLPNVQVTSYYGMTEIGTVSFHQSTEYRAGLCGEVMPNCQVKVVDPDTGRTLGPNQKGEILLKSNAMMSFYYGDPQATAEAVDEEESKAINS